MKQWYESLFENYAHKYDQECFVQGTAGECDFIEEEIERVHGLCSNNSRVVDNDQADG